MIYTEQVYLCVCCMTLDLVSGWAVIGNAGAKTVQRQWSFWCAHEASPSQTLPSISSGAYSTICTFQCQLIHSHTLLLDCCVLPSTGSASSSYTGSSSRVTHTYPVHRTTTRLVVVNHGPSQKNHQGDREVNGGAVSMQRRRPVGLPLTHNACQGSRNQRRTT